MRSGCGGVNLPALHRINDANWLLLPRALPSKTVEVREKRHRGPRVLWPLGSAAARATDHLPHWAERFRNAVDQAVFSTTIVTTPPDPPPTSGVREPRQPNPGRPPAALSLDDTSN